MTKTLTDQTSVLNYLTTHEIDIAHARAARVFADIVFETYVRSERTLGFKFSPVFGYTRKGSDFFQIIAHKNIAGIAYDFYRQCRRDPSLLARVMTKQTGIEQSLSDYWQDFRQKPQPTKTETLAGLEQIITLAREWWVYSVIGEDKGSVIEGEIIPFFEQSHSLRKAEAKELVETLAHPDEPSSLALERQHFFTLCALFLETGDTEEFKLELQRYMETYFYKDTDFYDRRVIDMDVVRTQIDEEISGKTIEAMRSSANEIEATFRDIQSKKERLYSSVTLSTEEEGLLKFARESVLWIDQRKAGMMKQLYYLFDILHQVASTTGVSYEDLTLCTPAEVANILRTSEIPAPQELEKRRDRMMIVYEAGHENQVYFGNEAEQLFRAAQKGGGDQNEEVKGSVASKGKGGGTIEGVARIVLDPNNHDLNEGEILITSMTRIEFVPLMKKARAIVTDEGGIACHAAIVSRELGIPCIIGTKSATRVFRSGETIRLDMKTGRVERAMSNENSL